MNDKIQRFGVVITPLSFRAKVFSESCVLILRAKIALNAVFCII